MRGVTWLAAVAVMAVSVVSSGQAVTAGTGPTGHLVSLNFDQGPHVAIGLTTTTRVTVTVGIDEPSGPVTDPDILFLRYSGGSVDVPLTQTSLQGTVGTYVGSWVFGSTAAGVWNAANVAWLAGGVTRNDNPEHYTGFSTKFEIVGRDIPRVSWVRIPALVPYGARQWVQYTYRDSSGKPIVGWPVAQGFTSASMSLESATQCFGKGAGDPTGPLWPTKQRLTDAQGRITVRVDWLVRDYWIHVDDWTTTCLWLATAPDAKPAGQSGLDEQFPEPRQTFRSVSIGVSATRTHVGHTYYVTGFVYSPHGDVAVGLLRSGRWTWAAQGKVRADGSYRIPVTAVAGRHPICVWASSGRMVPKASRVLVVIGPRA